MEIWELYDCDRKPLGLTVERGGIQPPNTYRTAVHVCIFGKDGRMLIQQRQSTKSGWPDKYDISLSGSAISGEDSRTAAQREAAEELGLSLDLTDIPPALTVTFNGGFDDFYIVKADPEPALMTLQEEEVQSVQWATLSEIETMIKDGRFIPYKEGLIALLFGLSGSSGVHSL